MNGSGKWHAEQAWVGRHAANVLIEVENGRITSAVKNLRWNESPVFMLNNLEMMSPPVRVSAGESGDVGSPVLVPAVKAHDFTFTSLSDAV